jgi:hypothetical protein
LTEAGIRRHRKPADSFQKILGCISPLQSSKRRKSHIGARADVDNVDQSQGLDAAFHWWEDKKVWQDRVDDLDVKHGVDFVEERESVGDAHAGYSQIYYRTIRREVYDESSSSRAFAGGKYEVQWFQILEAVEHFLITRTVHGVGDMHGQVSELQIRKAVS